MRQKRVTEVGLIAGGCLLLLLLQACMSVGTDSQTMQPPPPDRSRTYVFTCADGFSFVARTEQDLAWLFLPSGTLALQKGSDEAYRSGGVTFRVKQQVGMLEGLAGSHHNCRNNPRQATWEHAKLNGADFRAIGNEPGWSLEIHNQDKIILLTDYGSKRYVYDLPMPQIDTDTRMTRYIVGQEMTLIISGEPCSDSMSGEIFESQVKVVHQEKILYGCGRALH